MLVQFPRTYFVQIIFILFPTTEVATAKLAQPIELQLLQLQEVWNTREFHLKA